MTTISVPLNRELVDQLDELVLTYGSNRSAVMRKALEYLAEEETLKSILIAEKEYQEGKIIRGDLDKILFS